MRTAFKEASLKETHHLPNMLCLLLQRRPMILEVVSSPALLTKTKQLQKTSCGIFLHQLHRSNSKASPCKENHRSRSRLCPCQRAVPLVNCLNPPSPSRKKRSKKLEVYNLATVILNKETRSLHQQSQSQSKMHTHLLYHQTPKLAYRLHRLR